jgi:hypothetical protein
MSLITPQIAESANTARTEALPSTWNLTPSPSPATGSALTVDSAAPGTC